MPATAGWTGPVPDHRPWLKHYDDFVPRHIDYPRLPLDALLDRTAAIQPDKPCTRFFGRQLSYRRVLEDSTRFAAGLRERGVKKGDKVVLLLPNSPQFVIAYYGLLKAGAVIVPLNPLSSERELTFFLTDSGAETAVTIPLFLGKLALLVGKTPLRRVICSRLSDFLPFPLNLVMRLQERKQTRGLRLEGVEPFSALLRAPLPAGLSPQPVLPEDTACLIYSGGTTGVAKGIMLSHFNLVANAHQISAWGRLSAEKGRILAVLPLFHGFGMSVTMNSAILVGGEIVLMPRFGARDVLRAIQKTRPVFFIGVPTMFVAFSNLPDVARYDLSSLKGIFVGAAPLTRAIKDDFEGKTGGRMIEGYGLTEAVTAIMANPYQGMHKLGSIGIPFPDVDVKILSLDDGHELPPGQLGEIVLRSPTVMLGYYQNPEETRKALSDDWLLTGDIGYVDEDGYFYITDRKKELIIVGGFNVFPREIDELIYQHPKVREGITVGLPDAYKGEKIKVFIVLKEGVQGCMPASNNISSE
ncbi:MAG: long-chain fatty acid--CoA ligase [Syntrophobacteraceae bacterium]|nr:long-chain fatty acid--CoA ligase [Syntrophobacteraceae bacterium]